MHKIIISCELYDLVREITSNLEYYLSENIGYMATENCRKLKNSITLKLENTVEVELPNEIIEEIMSKFDPSTDVTQAVNMLLLCAYMFGGV